MVPNIKDINHAQFSDDTLFLGGASINSTRSFKKELDIYKEVSGSKINYLKKHYLRLELLGQGTG